jgi:hypothetical protein
MNTPYNKGISNFEDFALNNEKAIPEMEMKQEEDDWIQVDIGQEEDKQEEEEEKVQ